MKQFQLLERSFKSAQVSNINVAKIMTVIRKHLYMSINVRKGNSRLFTGCGPNISENVQYTDMCTFTSIIVIVGSSF